MYTVVNLIPTGVGAAVGGFAGDGGPVARLLAAVCDRLVTHPNAVNAAPMLALPPNALYVEGHALDGWLAGDWVLRPGPAPAIGLLIDRAVEGMPVGSLEAVLNATDAVRAVHGVTLVGYRLTERPLGCRVTIGAGGASGEVGDVDALLDGARALLAAGAGAIAIVADMGPLDPALEAAYQAGEGADPIGGLEAVLSHLVVSELGVPAAHAPLSPFDPTPPARVDARAAAEFIGHTYVPCVLMGLASHPALVRPHDARAGDLGVDDVDAVVVPAGCLGGPGVLAAHARGIPVIAVRENTTVLSVDAATLGLDGVWHADNYLEAAGLLAAHRAGVDWRACRRPLPTLARL